MATLKQLALAHFREIHGEDYQFTPAEETLLEAAPIGEPANFSTGDKEKDDPTNSEAWSPDRTIRADLIRWLCVKPEASKRIDPKGLQIVSAIIVGKLDLSFAQIKFSLAFVECYLSDTLIIQYASVPFLHLSGSHVHGIDAKGIEVRGDVNLCNGFNSTGEVLLLGANIGGTLNCSGGTFSNESGKALSADRIVVCGSVHLRELFRSTGEVRLLGAKIGGSFDCRGGTFSNESGNALNADGIEVRGYVHLGSRFNSAGEVRFHRAKIGGDFDCREGTFSNESGNALNANGIEVRGDVNLCDGFSSTGVVRFPGAKVGGDFDCDRGTFFNKSGHALCADGVEVNGTVNLCDGFRSSGEVRFTEAKIGGSFECNKGTFSNESDNALCADRIEVRGNVNLDDGFRSTGAVLFSGAKIGGNFRCNGGIFTHVVESGFALYAAQVKVSGAFLLPRSGEGNLSLAYGKAGVLINSARGSWPSPGKLQIDGYEYDRITMDRLQKAAHWIQWIRRQYPDGEKRTWDLFFRSGYRKREFNLLNRFSPQPYRQLAKVLRESGHESDAKKVFIAMEDDRRRFSKLSWPVLNRPWRFLLKWTIRYGYQPFWALFPLAVLWVVGAILFGNGREDYRIVPAKERVYMAENWDSAHWDIPDEYPAFSPIVYSLDTLIPIIDLHQENYWLPSANHSGRGLRRYLWFHIAAGWFLTTLAAVGFTGLIRKES